MKNSGFATGCVSRGRIRLCDELVGDLLDDLSLTALDELALLRLGRETLDTDGLALLLGSGKKLVVLLNALKESRAAVRRLNVLQMVKKEEI